ncbi:ferritin-like domain-containing protein [uncultured Litoreibacter sp.]|uniref:ferritin-like domain-containing protein n=1 Tax=uncultured Litoreibacter sp. TaxID=1392394 RepID=UPI0026089818|nr:ferritin-like domain-containing protein [uncultured Litoreibacter sp.]
MNVSLRDMAVEVLSTADPHAKVAFSRAHAATWRDARATGTEPPLGRKAPPDFPARPASPELLNPRDVPHRKPGTEAGRIAMLHAIAHIELNAVDLHWDLVARFPDVEFPLGFFDDWVKAADEESKHFKLLSDCLQSYGSHYGALPAHAGMWQAATDTAQDIMGRLAVVPMVLEARGLDVTPGMIKLFQQAKDTQTVAALNVIYAEEVAHVAYGSKWFHFLCGRENLDPKIAFHGLVKRYFHSKLRPPFNEEKRAEAGLAPDFYWPLTEAELQTPAALT